MTVSRGRKRERLLAVYGNVCFWCGYPMLWSKNQKEFHRPQAMSIDELKPRSRGGLREIDNQVLCHVSCNAKRGNMIAPKAAFDRHHAMLQSAGVAVAGTIPAAECFTRNPNPTLEEAGNGQGDKRGGQSGP